jgi:hypothetical protein
MAFAAILKVKSSNEIYLLCLSKIIVNVNLAYAQLTLTIFKKMRNVLVLKNLTEQRSKYKLTISYRN